MLHNKEIWIYRNDYQWKFPCKLLNTAINTTFSNLPRITFGRKPWTKRKFRRPILFFYFLNWDRRNLKYYDPQVEAGISYNSWLIKNSEGQTASKIARVRLYVGYGQALYEIFRGCWKDMTARLSIQNFWYRLRKWQTENPINKECERETMVNYFCFKVDEKKALWRY